MDGISDPMVRMMEKLQERALAAVGGQRDNAEAFHVLEREAMTDADRRLLSGYLVEGDETAVATFCDSMQMAVVVSMVGNPSTAAAECAVRFALAQVFLAGVLYERERAQ